MKAFFAISLLLASATAAAGSGLERAVANDIQALLDDTVNEGSQNAQVIYRNDSPAVKCKVSPVKNQATKQWAFCRVDFELTFEDSEEIQERRCALLYSFEPGDPIRALERGSEKTFDSCMETLSEGP